MDDKIGRPLDDMNTGARFVVRSVLAHAHHPEWQSWLEEIGFLAGEQGRLVARGVPGGDPLVVRIGSSTFALRRAEASCVLVQAKQEQAQ
jgi:ferrous iron transport protein A